MTEIPFRLTKTGRAFYEATMPKLVAELAQLNANLAELTKAIDRQQGAQQTASNATTEHGSHVASSLNPHP